MCICKCIKPGLLLLLVSGVTTWAHGVCAETAGGVVSVKLFQPSAGCGSPLPESPFQLCCTAEGSPRPCQAAASSAGCTAAWQALPVGCRMLSAYTGDSNCAFDGEMELKCAEF